MIFELKLEAVQMQVTLLYAYKIEWHFSVFFFVFIPGIDLAMFVIIEPLSQIVRHAMVNWFFFVCFTNGY